MAATGVRVQVRCGFRRYIAAAGVVAALLLGTLLWRDASRRNAQLGSDYAQFPGTIPVLTTRGDFRNGSLVSGVPADAYRWAGSIPGLEGAPAPDDLIVIVHGLNNTETKALYKFGIAAEGLRRNGFRGGLVGFSWDGDTSRDPLFITGYRTARRHAVGNGKKLARFLTDYLSAHPTSRVHLLGYSMGARLILEAILELDRMPQAASLSRITSVHLVGASVDDEEVQVDNRYGRPIERRVVRLVNYFSHEDNKLGKYYLLTDGDQALGENDIEHPERRPQNYLSVDAERELKSTGSEGEVDYGASLGDNHSGYLGLRDREGVLVDDGVMDLIARQLQSFR